MSKIKVLLTYIVYPMAIATYFKKALEHRTDIELKVCGPYTGSWMPWLGGMNLPAKYAIPPDLSLPYSGNIGEYNYDMVKAQLGEWTPDLILQIDAGLHFKYKPSDGMVVTVGTDPHVLNSWYDTPRKYSDKFFNMQATYSKNGDIFLPYAYSIYDHYPQDSDEEKVDAVLIGMPYQTRVEWVNALKARGVSVIFENGPVFDEARAAYARGSIGLDWSSMDDLNARAFELPAMKLAPVLNLVPDIGRFFDQGVHYEGFTDLREAVERVVWLKENPLEREAMAEQAYYKVAGQTYDARIGQILKECEFV